jgi:hypothetical protein
MTLAEEEAQDIVVKEEAMEAQAMEAWENVEAIHGWTEEEKTMWSNK